MIPYRKECAREEAPFMRCSHTSVELMAGAPFLEALLFVF